MHWSVCSNSGGEEVTLKTSAKLRRLERLAARRARRPSIEPTSYSERWQFISMEQLDRTIAELDDGKQPSDPDVVAALQEDLAGPLRWISELDAEELEQMILNLEVINEHLEKQPAEQAAIEPQFGGS